MSTAEPTTPPPQVRPAPIVVVKPYGAGEYEFQGELYIEQGGERRQIHTAGKQMETSNVQLALP